MFARQRARSAVPRLALIIAFATVVVLPLLAASVAAAKPGDTIWSRQFSTGAKADAFLDVARGPGDVYYCTGIARATDETSTLLLIKYKSDGTKLWSRLYQPADGNGAAGDGRRRGQARRRHRRRHRRGRAAGVGQGPRRARAQVLGGRACASGSCATTEPRTRTTTSTGLALDSAGTAFVSGEGARRHHRPGLSRLSRVTPAGVQKWT